MNIAILGAGPAGLAQGYLLSKNHEVHVFENSNKVGGYASTFELWGKKVEIGPHFFNIGSDARLLRLTEEVIGQKYQVYKRKSYILNGKYTFSYPPQALNLALQLGFVEILRGFKSFIKSSLSKNEGKTAESYLIKKLGEYLYNLLFADSTRKIWGTECANLSKSYVESLIGAKKLKFNLRKVFKRKTLKDPLHIYPNGGFGALWEGLRIRSEERGVKYFLGTFVKDMSYRKQTNTWEIELGSGEVKSYDYVVSCIPIASFLRLEKTHGPSILQLYEEVKYRSLVMVYLKVRKNVMNGQCFYIYSKDSAITRVTNFSGFNSESHDDTSVVLVEYWCSLNDLPWTFTDTELAAYTRNQFHRIDAFEHIEILDFHTKRIEKAYQIPEAVSINRKGRVIRSLMKYHNISFIGRDASPNFNYGMEDAVMDAFETTQLINQRKMVHEYTHYRS